MGGGDRGHQVRPLPRWVVSPSTTEEKIDDVATLNTLTASNRSISLHVPWDDPEDPDGLRQYAAAGASSSMR